MIIEKSVETLDEVSQISYEKALEQFMQSSEELNKIQSEISDMTHSLEIYEAISDTITKCGGVTKSLEVMFGENFSDAVSMEGETTEKIKAGVKAAGEKAMELIKRFIEWVKDLINVNKIRANKLKKATIKEDLKFPVTVVEVIDFKDADVMENIDALFKAYKKLDEDAAVQSMKDAINAINKSERQGNKIELKSKEEVKAYIDKVVDALYNYKDLMMLEAAGFQTFAKLEGKRKILAMLPRFILAQRKAYGQLITKYYKSATDLVK